MYNFKVTLVKLFSKYPLFNMCYIIGRMYIMHSLKLIGIVCHVLITTYMSVHFCSLVFYNYNHYILVTNILNFFFKNNSGLYKFQSFAHWLQKQQSNTMLNIFMYHISSQGGQYQYCTLSVLHNEQVYYCILWVVRYYKYFNARLILPTIGPNQDHHLPRVWNSNTNNIQTCHLLPGPH